MLEDAQREVRIEFLQQERTRLQEIINRSQDIEATALSLGKHEDAERQRQQMRLPATQDLERVKLELRNLGFVG